MAHTAEEYVEIAVRLDLPELAAIITKSIASITPEEHQNIRKRWLSIDYKKKVDYGLLWKISIGFLLVLAAVVA